MEAIAASNEAWYRHWHRGLLQALVALCATAAAATAAVRADAPAAASYRAVLLSTNPGAGAVINARGQVAFTETRNGGTWARFYDGSRFVDFGTLGGTNASVAGLNDRGQVVFNVVRNGMPRVMFYDGARIRDIGTLGGPGASAAGLNQLGQVAGTSGRATERATASHLFRWSQAGGMADLGVPGQGDPVVQGINNRGEVFGLATFLRGGLPQPHGFFWSPGTGTLEVGVTGEVFYSTAMNDAGTIVGYGGPGSYSVRAFRWTRSEGLSDMGTLPNEFTWATHVNRAGQVVGATPFTPQAEPHPFLWTPGQGLLDLGVGGAERGAGTKVNEHGMVIGYLFKDFILSHGFIWTRETGLIEIGAGSPTLQTFAADVNQLGQVVGGLGRRAFIWTRAQGFVDLNTLVAGAQDKQLLTWATAIADNGAILATGGAGLYLLVPNG